MKKNYRDAKTRTYAVMAEDRALRLINIVLLILIMVLIAMSVIMEYARSADTSDVIVIAFIVMIINCLFSSHGKHIDKIDPSIGNYSNIRIKLNKDFRAMVAFDRINTEPIQQEPVTNMADDDSNEDDQLSDKDRTRLAIIEKEKNVNRLINYLLLVAMTALLTIIMLQRMTIDSLIRLMLFATAITIITGPFTCHVNKLEFADFNSSFADYHVKLTKDFRKLVASDRKNQPLTTKQSSDYDSTSIRSRIIADERCRCDDIESACLTYGMYILMIYFAATDLGNDAIAVLTLVIVIMSFIVYLLMLEHHSEMKDTDIERKTYEDYKIKLTPRFAKLVKYDRQKKQKR